ncbi:hypothetical protein LCGC14_1657820 [marine sediment metagenome]|uniref:Uncharacterized protein n=1 Tax=marine sediment metagenome TaxID=412755 RepID=A0A0F9KAT1_9ZZZZ
MLEKPRVRIQDLTGDARTVMLTMVRLFMQGLPELLQSQGIDCAEEALIQLINEGWVKVCTDETHENYWLEVYDTNTESYVKPLGDNNQWRSNNE